MAGVLADVVPFLRCPVCAGELSVDGPAVRCPAGHSYDVARQGYVNLLTGSTAGTADTAAMVAARADFLASGHFDPILRAVGAAVPPAARLVVDVGAGTGEYLATALAFAPQAVGIALDVSVPAVKRAVRIPDRAGAVVADAWQSLPLAGGVADAVLNVFAPRNPAEFRRILRTGGTLIVVTPLPGHLAELTSSLGLLGVEVNKLDRLDAALGDQFRLTERLTVIDTVRMTHTAAEQIVAMGPSAHHVDLAVVAQMIAELPALIRVTFAVHVSSYQAI